MASAASYPISGGDGSAVPVAGRGGDDVPHRQGGALGSPGGGQHPADDAPRRGGEVGGRAVACVLGVGAAS